MLKSHFRAKSNGYGDFLVRVPTKLWTNLHLKWSKFIQIMLLNDISLYFYTDLLELHSEYF
jgi:hypothetical protein